MTQSTPAFVLAFAAVCIFSACSSDNDPATGGSASSPGSAGARASAGAPAIAGSAAIAGAPAVAGAPAGGGAPSAGGGAAPATAGAAGAPAGGAGAPAGGAGAPAGGAGAPASGDFSPLCSAVQTAAGVSPTKGGVCTAADPQLCYKGCGPENTGFKSETCTTGAYAEQSGCSFKADQDFACYKIPATPDAACPTTTIVASTPCTVAPCTACTDATKHYFDSQMNLKTGYCVCPTSATGTSKWSCASDTAWPCPTGKGC